MVGANRCRMHGGATPRGKDSPNFKTGRYSKSLPTRLTAQYQAAQADQRLLYLKDEIALVDARIQDLLSRADSGEAGIHWRQIKKLYGDILSGSREGDMAKVNKALGQMRGVIDAGVGDYAVWDEIMGLVDKRRRLVESQRQHYVQMQQVITADQLMVLASAIIDVVRENVRDRGTMAAISRGIGQLISEGT
jgi:hypothetical protein